MITIQGIGQTASGAAYDAQQLGQQSLNVNSHAWKRMTEKFLKGEPKILGVVQIVIALMNLTIGIMMISATVTSSEMPPVSVYIGYPVWGSLMVRSSLGLNITSSVFAFTGIIIHSLSPSIYSYHLYYCSYRDYSESCHMTISILMGLDIVLVILSALEFCIGVSLSAFGCRVMCYNPGGVSFGFHLSMSFHVFCHSVISHTNPETEHSSHSSPLSSHG
ncbi:Membrane-spanning 4-domains subfamily A member 4A [Microtus ochrogaster]|uniref:Membrane-spanning 4-domains subfamily A member 4A n=1 Tax=Microtus ochrogaster TaxID=79684 RepID=A0A8J6KWW4_MICOH|nr:Membrane-spanning 4-domains subfamily A member 4A [Microtus ochrogaster]